MILRSSFSIKLVTFASILSCQAFAAETAKILPKGIYRARVVTIMTNDINERFDENGRATSFTPALNTTVTMSDMAKKDARLNNLIYALNSTQAGLGDNLAATNLYSDFNLRVQTILPALEYGIAEDWNLGIRTPIVKRTVTNKFDAVSVNNGAALAQQMGNVNPTLTNGLYDFGSRSFNAAFFSKTIFTDKGYVAPHNFEKTELGDIEMGAKHKIYKDDYWYTSVLFGLRLPTGSTPVLNDTFDKGSGNGTWALATQGFADYRPLNFLQFGSAAKITQNLPDTRQRAVPKDADDTLPSVRPEDGQVQNVTRKMSPELATELSSTLFFFEDQLSFATAYQYVTRGKDNYEGPGNLYYEGMSKNSDIESHAIDLQLTYSTIPLFKKKQFKVPLEINAIYNNTFAGRNIPIVSYVRSDLIVFF